MTHSHTSALPSETVAVLGADGTMGFAMARNIARAGLPVRAWDRSRDKAEPLAGAGAEAVVSAMDSADGALPVLARRSDASLVRESASQHGLDLPLLDMIARRLHQGAAEHGDQDFSATYLASAPGQAA